jgi:hypothetical protein
VPLRRLRLDGLVVAALVAGAAAIAVASSAWPAAAAGSSACIASTRGVLASVDAKVLNNVYANELAGQEVSDDLAQITSAPDLIAAVTADNAAATFKAVQALVYHPAWHIVRLRVLDASGRLLADFGGPDVIAPVSGVLRSASGAQIGTFVMSVQDDVGVTKLESDFVGDPIGIYYGGRRVAELGAKFPRTQPTGALLTLGKVAYLPVSLTYNAFPNGTLHAVILVPPASKTQIAESCATVRANEFGRVAMRLTNLLGPIAQHYYGYSYWVHIYTDADVFVRAADGTQLAASDGSDPPPLPLSGSFSYESQQWLVFSFEPQPTARVYLLVPPS